MVTKDGIVPVKGGQYTLLSDDQIQDLHNATITVYRFLQGIDTSRDAIGLDAFRDCGHHSRFLKTKHAVKYVRNNERWNPTLTDRNSWDTWMRKTGGKDMSQRANVEAQKILAEHRPEYVSKEQAQEIDKIANAAQQWFIENWQDDIH